MNLILGTTEVLIDGEVEEVPNWYFKFEFINENEEKLLDSSVKNQNEIESNLDETPIISSDMANSEKDNVETEPKTINNESNEGDQNSIKEEPILANKNSTLPFDDEKEKTQNLSNSSDLIVLISDFE